MIVEAVVVGTWMLVSAYVLVPSIGRCGDALHRIADEVRKLREQREAELRLRAREKR